MVGFSPRVFGARALPALVRVITKIRPAAVPPPHENPPRNSETGGACAAGRKPLIPAVLAPLGEGSDAEMQT